MESAYILTGGQSRRFGQPKCIVDINGTPMLEIVYSNLSEMFSDIYQVGKQPYLDIPFIKDGNVVQCPLIGIAAALSHSTTDWIFIIACDLPVIGNEQINTLGQTLNNKYQIVVPEIDGFKQYTCAFYNKNILPIVREQLYKNDYALYSLVEKLNYKIVEFSETEKKYFTNVNTPEKLQVVESILNCK